MIAQGQQQPTVNRHPLIRALQKAGSKAAGHLQLDRQARFWTRELAPMRSKNEVLARVIDVRDETHDVKTFVLRANRNWKGHTPGQFVRVEVEIGGVRRSRCYSVSSAPILSPATTASDAAAPIITSRDPGSRTLTITVKRVPEGMVSNWLHDHLTPGDIIRISRPDGDFVLPDDAAALVFVAAGSGVTPILSMVRELAQRSKLGGTTMIYYARSAADLIAHDELLHLAAEHAGFCLHVITDDMPDGIGGFDERRLQALLPDLFERAAFVCGPAGLIDRVEAMWRNNDAGDKLRRERFTLPKPAIVGNKNTEHAVTLSGSGKRVSAVGSGTLLDELERAGERPVYGCRMGICRMCRCRKVSGSVTNVVTGEVSNEPDEDIQICINTANSDIELAL